MLRCGAFGALALLWALGPVAEAAGPLPYSTDHVLVRLRPGVRPAVQAGAAAGPRRWTFRAAAAGAAAERAGARTLARHRVRVVTPVFDGGFAAAGLAADLGLDRWYRVRVPAGSDTPALADDLGRLPAFVERVGLDGIGGAADTIPDDADFDEQWNMLNLVTPVADVNVTPGWDMSVGDETLVLAVLDAGIDEHFEIADRLVAGRNVAADPDNDDTADVCISHGTHVAGIAAATGNNGLGIAGVDWRVGIMPVRVLNSCSGPESFVAEGLVWAADNGADVINMSLQYYTGSDVLRDAVQYVHALDIPMVAASGNLGASSVAFPARWPETIAAGAYESDGSRWSSSNGGPNLDVMAPGVQIWSLKDAGLFQNLSGTSMAAPHVAGIVCLMKALDPALPADEIRDVLRATAADMGDPGFDEPTGFGRVNAGEALLAVNAGLGDLDGDGSIGVTDFLALLAAWGPCPAPPAACPSDLDGDGLTGVPDLLELLANWG